MVANDQGMRLTEGGPGHEGKVNHAQRTEPRTEPTDPIWVDIEKHRKERDAYHTAVREKYAFADIPDGTTDEMLAPDARFL
jgi:hypothetical protein